MVLKAKIGHRHHLRICAIAQLRKCFTLAAGAKTVEFRSVDNVEQAPRLTVIPDNTPPAVTIASPLDQALVNFRIAFVGIVEDQCWRARGEDGKCKLKNGKKSPWKSLWPTREPPLEKIDRLGYRTLSFGAKSSAMQGDSLAPKAEPGAFNQVADVFRDHDQELC